MNAPLNSVPNKDLSVRQLMRPLNVFFENPDVTEIVINRPFEVWTEDSIGFKHHAVPELSMDYLKRLANSICNFNGMKWAGNPIISVILPDGERGQIVSPPACLDGTFSMTFRKHSTVDRSLDQLDEAGAFDSWKDVSFNQPDEDEIEIKTHVHGFDRLESFEAELLHLKRRRDIKSFLKLAVASHRNIVVAGKTGSGKTTVSRSMIQFVPSTERIITIEDVHELFLNGHENKVHLIYGHGEGRVSAKQALASCMRMKPDRIFLAELRGDEAWDYIQGLNTGHPGSITTTHANGAVECFSRVCSLIKNSESGKTLDVEYVKKELYMTLDVVLFFHRRKLVEVFYDPIFKHKNIS